ncbi:Nacht and ankyrin domain protein [Oopsacas minuta]|uniref:Nacht and ankyrin domain protein n=1 Tax=Oopsacas minuta TaxID=111878 RepID=A0AAV7JDE5_9METZ|nr:Nacht and ankyrin domain protein [Oopsacas minuta]
MSKVAPMGEAIPLLSVIPVTQSEPVSELTSALLSDNLEHARCHLSAPPGEYTSISMSEDYSWKGESGQKYRTITCTYKQDLLVLAAKSGDESTIRSLLPSHQGETERDTALWFSCRYNHVPVAVLLFETGANPAFELFGIPCVHLSAYYACLPLLSLFLGKHPDLLQLPIQSGTVHLDLKVPDSRLVKFRDGALPCHMCAVGSSPSLPLLELLIPSETGVDLEDKKGCTPLIYACKAGNRLWAETLLDKGANVEHPSLTGRQSFLYAARRGDQEVIELLVRRQASLITTDKQNRGVFFYAKDEEVANSILDCVLRYRREYPHVLLPICELVSQGYTQTIHSFLDTLISRPSEDTIRLHLEPIDSVPIDSKTNQTLLSLLCELDPTLPLYDSLVLRGYVDYYMIRYGYLYLSVMFLELFVYLVALSVTFLLGVKTMNSNNSSTPLEIFRHICEVYVLLRWLFHSIFEVVELGIIFKNKYLSLDRDTHKITSLNPTHNSFIVSFVSAVREYITDGSNTVDYLLLTSGFVYACLRVTSLFTSVLNIQTIFAVFVYFFSFLLLLRHIVVIPVIGTYLQTLYEALKDSILFLIVFFIPLFQFSGMFYISYLAPPPDPNLFNTSGKYDSVRTSFDGEYYWLLLNGLRLLVEQGAIIKFNYLEVYNWLMVIVFMSFAFLTVLVMRSLFVGRISSNYKRINQHAMRYTTYRSLRFLNRIQTKSIYSLNRLKYLLNNSKEMILKKGKIRDRYLSEYNRLFSNKRHEIDYVRALEKAVTDLRKELTDRMEVQERKLDEVLRCINILIE